MNQVRPEQRRAVTPGTLLKPKKSDNDVVEETVHVTDTFVGPRGKRPLKTEISVRRIATRELQSVSQPGCYSLVIELKQRKKIRVGKLGKAEFQPGIYVYTGSAMGGLRARLLRHLSGTKKMRWHIDYFLNNEQASVKKIFLYPAAPDQECRQNQKIASIRGAQSALRKFGASDCNSGCRSHLIFFPRGSHPRIKGIELRLR